MSFSKRMMRLGSQVLIGLIVCTPLSLVSERVFSEPRLAPKLNPCALFAARIARNYSNDGQRWIELLFRRSRLRKKLFSELEGRLEPTVTAAQFQDDSIWWRDVIESYWDLLKPSKNCFAQDGRFWKLYGTLVERWYMEDPTLASERLIPGPAIRVGNDRHADGWLYHVVPGLSGEYDLVIDGFVEMKGSETSYHRASHQVYGFVTRLADPKAGVDLYGKTLPRSRILIQTRFGVLPIDSLVQLRQELLAEKPDKLESTYLKYFDQSFYRIILPKSEHKRYGIRDHAKVIAAPFTRKHLRKEFVRFLRRHYDGKITENVLDESQ